MCYRNKLAIKHGSRSLNVKDVKIHNHLPNNYVMGNKKAMLKTLSDYYALRG